MKKLFSIFLILCLCFSLFSCNEKEEEKEDNRYFIFNKNTIQKIGNEDYADFIEDYCNKFYEVYKRQCKSNKLLLNEDEDWLIEGAHTIKEIMGEATDRAIGTSLEESEVEKIREIFAFYGPFCDLGAALAQEILDAEYIGVPLDPNADMSDYLASNLSASYKQQVEEAFETIKRNYCK